MIPVPAPLLDRIAQTADYPIALSFCPNFERGAWRYKMLAEHLFDWLPDVALKPNERNALLYEPNRQLAWSCRRLFDTENPEKRGEIGEILLHALCRQEFGTHPFVARLFYKMRTNDSVTSVDVAHIFYDEDTDDIEILLGEAKLYDNMQKARYAALASIAPIWDESFMDEMKALIGPKINPQAPFAARLQELFEDKTPIDEIVDRIVIPICLAADFPPTALATSRSNIYIQEVEKEMLAARDYFISRVPVDVEFVVFVLPMDCKEKLENAVNARIRSYLR